VPVAPAILADDHADLGALSYPVVVKPNDEGSSKGIARESFCHTPAEAADRASHLRATYGCPVLVEEFLPGAEITVAIRGNGSSARVLGAMEIAPTDASEPFLYSVEVKREWRRRVNYHIPPRVPASTLDALEEYALTAYRLLGCRDLARLDFRLDAIGRPHFLECNPLPGLNPENSDVVILSRPQLAYGELIRGIVRDTLNRFPSVAK